YISLSDVLEFLNQPSVLNQLGRTQPISLRTAQNWLNVIGFQYGKAPSSMYVDRYEREDVVEY
ncbi:uncharacterized protein FOMMEDRAFT_96461, partial [Fomitiporia mediterranea MF3/22]|uniref:uncharacterized protein n=1 Tax=Fomitiporia mediterranea (strain MF3/22) TaxID=694068 RepID=UPI0004409790